MSEIMRVFTVIVPAGGELKGLGVNCDFLNYLKVYDAKGNPVNPASILISINNSLYYNMNQLLPAKSDTKGSIQKISLKNTNSFDVFVDFVAGGEYFSIQANNVIIGGDQVGLAKASQLPASLTASGNLKTALSEENIGLMFVLQNIGSYLAGKSTILTNATITANGSTVLWSGGASGREFLYKQLDLLIAVQNAPTGTNPTLQFFVDILEPQTNAVVKTYAGSVLTTGPATDYITVISNTLSNVIQVRWVVGGTNPSWTGVYATLLIR